jgi:hypothetical protein
LNAARQRDARAWTTAGGPGPLPRRRHRRGLPEPVLPRRGPRPGPPGGVEDRGTVPSFRMQSRSADRVQEPAVLPDRRRGLRRRLHAVPRVPSRGAGRQLSPRRDRTGRPRHRSRRAFRLDGQRHAPCSPRA